MRKCLLRTEKRPAVEFCCTGHLAAARPILPGRLLAKSKPTSFRSASTTCLICGSATASATCMSCFSRHATTDLASCFLTKSMRLLLLVARLATVPKLYARPRSLATPATEKLLIVFAQTNHFKQLQRVGRFSNAGLHAVIERHFLFPIDFFELLGKVNGLASLFKFTRRRQIEIVS